MILVNLRQSTTAASNPDEIRSAAESAWANISDAAMDEYADYVLAVRDNVIIGVFTLQGWERLEDGRIEFDLGSAPELEGLVGCDSPLRWKRGQANPVMYLATPESGTDVVPPPTSSNSPTRRPAHARRRTHRITIETRGLSDDDAADLHHTLITVARLRGHVHTFRTTSLVGEMQDAKARLDYSYKSAPSPTAI